ncbi:MAG: hypothetical protein EXQ95_15530 [Alphaproteobacteria bacterium]|nr:hypothetical protein [Alphaproteobacteria bacterium]
MAAIATEQAQLNAAAPASFGAGVGSGMRQALALIHGAVETNQTIRREARFIERRVPAPFTGDRVDIRASAGPDEAPAPGEVGREPAEIRRLSLTGQPVAEREPVRGNLVDIES